MFKEKLKECLRNVSRNVKNCLRNVKKCIKKFQRLKPHAADPGVKVLGFQILKLEDCRLSISSFRFQVISRQVLRFQGSTVGPFRRVFKSQVLCYRSFVLHSCRLGDCWFAGCCLHVLGSEFLDSYALDCQDHDLGFLVLGL